MRVLTRVLQVVLLALTIVIGVSAGAVIVSQTAWFRDWLRGFVVRQGDQYLNGRLAIGRLGGNIFFGVELENIAVTMHGEPVITIKDARIAYSVFQLLTRNLVITSLRLNEPIIHVRRQGGAWDLSQLVKRKQRETTRTGPGLPVAMNDVIITGGSFVFDDRPVGTSGVDVPRLLNRLDAQFSFAYAPVHYTVDISRISFRGRSPQFALNQLSGKVAVSGGTLYLNKVAVRTAASDVKIDGAVYDYTRTPSLDVHVTSDKLDLDEIARIIPPLGRIDLKPALDVIAKGPLSHLGLHLDVKSPASGEIAGDVVLDMTAPERRISGTVHTRDINVGAIVRKPALATAITGVTAFDLRLLEGRTGTLPVRATYHVQAQIATAFGYLARDLNARGRMDGNRVDFDATALAYGARTSATGTVLVPYGRTPLGFDLRGHVADADLRRLPPNLEVPRPASRLNLAAYHITGRVTRTASNVSGDALFLPSTLAGATIGDGTKATFSYVGRRLAYTADGTIANLDLQRIGRQFDISALKQQRFRSDVNGRFTVSGSGTRVADLRLDASGTIANSVVMGTTFPQATFQATIANATLLAKTSGQFRDLNPATVTGEPSYKGNLSGGFDSLSVGLANLGAPSGTTSILDDLSLAGRLGLTASSIGGLKIDQATFDGQYANRTADVRQLAVTGSDVRMKANGAVTFTDHGQSDLSYQLETPALDRVGKLIDKPLQGAATVNGQVTGNASDLRTTGTLKGSNLAYGNSHALEMVSQYDVRLPGLDASRALVHATSTATFVTAGGQEINRIVATTSYGKQSLGFDADIEQPKRSLRAAGDLLLHPQHEEVHLRSLTLKSGNVSWQMAPGSQPAIRYANNSIAVHDVRLVSSGNQEIAAEGTIGLKASNLQARMSNVNLADVDALMLTNRQLGGVLNAQATITGPRDALTVAGQFAVSPGSFRQFKYQSLDGHVKYAQRRIDLDVRLQENPEASIEAAGSLPTALFTAAPVGAAAAAPVNLRVQSTPLDLGLVRGFTTDLQKVTGTAQANVALVGTAADPHMEGSIDLSNGAFTVMPSGVAYKALNAHIALQPDRVTVQNLSVTDEHGAGLTVSGELALHERQLGGVNLEVRGHQFEILHNQLGRMRVDPNLTIGGEIRQPKITGTLVLYTGTINIDKVLDLATSSAYSTTEETVAVSEGGQPGAAPIGQPVNQPAKTAESARAEANPGPPAAQPSKAAPAPPAPSAAASPFDAASIDLHVRVPDDLIVKGTDIRVGQSSVGLGNVNVTIGGDIHVQKPSASPTRLLGQVRTIRGSYDFQGRRFDIQRGGTVRFEGVEPPNPALDITATRLISGVETRVHVTGSVRRPRLDLSSNPPLDQADILSLIVFGQPSNQLGEGQQVSLAQRAGTIASGFVAGKLAQSIGSALNLDTFEIQTGADTGETGATVTVGEQIGQRLYVRLRQGVGADNVSEFVLDYQLTNFLRFQSTMTQGGTPTRNIMQRVQQSGADLIFLFSF
jgi:autotransporter translocation and assembly factor TamB